MPMPPSHYPPGWQEFSARIRFQRARGQCECYGQCGLHSRNPDRRRCIEHQGNPAIFANGKVRLTVAHLCQCTPTCLNPLHVIAACQRCHLRIDRFIHAKHRLATQKAKQTSQPAQDRIATPTPAQSYYPNQGGGARKRTPEGGTRGGVQRANLTERSEGTPLDPSKFTPTHRVRSSRRERHNARETNITPLPRLIST